MLSHCASTGRIQTHTHERRKPTGCVGFPVVQTQLVLYRANVFCPGPFRSASFVVRDALPDLEFVVTDAFECRRMKKHVLVCSGIDEPETLVRQPFDCALSHSVRFLKKELEECPTFEPLPCEASFIRRDDKAQRGTGIRVTESKL